MAATHSPSFEGQDRHSYARGIRDLLKSLWGGFRKSQAQQSEPSHYDSPDLGASAPRRSSLTITAYGDFRIETRGVSEGWWVTSVDESNGNRHDFYVQGGVIYHIGLGNQSTQFIVGRPVQRIMDSEKQAILHAVSVCEEDKLTA
jgi:hypothetical protein